MAVTGSSGCGWRLLSPVAHVPSGLLAPVRVWGVPFLLPVQDERGDVGALPAPRGLQEEQEGDDSVFWSLLLLGGHSFAGTAWAKVPLCLARL